MTPRLFCAPVDKNGEGILNPDSHLTCYEIKDVSGQPRFERRDIEVLDQFDGKDVQVLRQRCRKAALLCVPSTKRLVLP